MLVDFDGVYDPNLVNDRLLLGMKGEMAAFELSLLRQRSLEAIRQKAQAVASLQAELTVMQAKALSQVQPPLTAEQVEKLRGGEGGASEGRQNLESRARRQPAPPQSGTDENGLPPKQ